MNTRELNFAYKVRHALNETTENLSASTVDRLTSARQIALARKKNESPLRALVPQRFLAGNAGSFLDGHLSWMGRMGVVVPLVIVGLGLTGIYRYEQQRRVAETAEIDAAVLADELPLSAYLDHGFNAYLASRGE